MFDKVPFPSDSSSDWSPARLQKQDNFSPQPQQEKPSSFSMSTKGEDTWSLDDDPLLRRWKKEEAAGETQPIAMANVVEPQTNPKTQGEIAFSKAQTIPQEAPPESDLVQQTPLVQGGAAQMNKEVRRESSAIEPLALTPKKLTNYRPRGNFNKQLLITPQLETLQPKQFSTNSTTQVNNKELRPLEKGTQGQTQQALTPKQIAYTTPVSSNKELRPTPATETLQPKQFTSPASKETQKVNQPQKLAFNVPGVDAAKKWVSDKLAEFGQLGQLLWRVFQKSWSVLVSIASNPRGFIDNLATALKQGLQNFGKNIVGHLQTGLVDWLTGGLGIQQEINLESPQSIFSLALGLLGVNWSYIRQKAAQKIGEGNVRKLEKSFQLFMTLKNQGLAGLWSQIKNTMGDLKKTVIESIKNMLINEVITKAVNKLVLTIAPGGAIVQLAQACYKILSFLFDKVSKIAGVATIATRAVNEVASGKVTNAATSVELALVKSIPVLIGFFARLLGIDSLVARVKGLLLKLKDKIDELIEKLLKQAADWLSKLPKGTTSGKPKPPLPNYKHVFHHGTIYPTAKNLKKDDIEAIGGNDFGKGFYVHTKENWHKAKEWVEGKEEGWGVVSFPIPDDIWKKEVKQVDQLIFRFDKDHPDNMPENADTNKPFKDWADFVYHNKEFNGENRPRNDLPTWKYKIIQGPMGRTFKNGEQQTTRDNKLHQVAFTETGVYILNLPEAKKLRIAVGKPNKHKKKKK
jgi:hypothetical protein